MQMRSHPIGAVAAVVASWVLVVGCAGPSGASMVRLPPPEGWETDVGQSRVTKDDWFRNSADSPLAESAREGFERLDYWNPDGKYYFAGDIRRYPEPERFEMITTSGRRRPCERFGQITFEIDGALQTLQVYRLLDGDPEASMFLPFMDVTTGEATYPSGRYVDLVGAPGGPYVLDFNRAYNPSCAYGAPERFACPVTPPENRLRLAIEAGERGFITAAEVGS